MTRASERLDSRVGGFELPESNEENDAQPARASAPNCAKIRTTFCDFMQSRHRDRLPSRVIWPQGGRKRSYPKCFFQLIVMLDRFGLEGNKLIRLEGGDRSSVAQEDAVRGDGCDARSRREDADQIQRIGGADRDQLGARLLTVSRALSADCAEEPDCFGQSELLAADAADKVSAANVALCLQPPIDPKGFEPGHAQRFLFQQTPENDPVASKKRARIDLEGHLTLVARILT